jgi:hypothetical protein
VVAQPLRGVGGIGRRGHAPDYRSAHSSRRRPIRGRALRALESGGLEWPVARRTL